MRDAKKAVREQYGKIGAAGRTANGCCVPGCCSGEAVAPAPCDEQTSAKLGYSAADLSDLPEGADLGLGCGNPQAIAALRDGETVLDLGSGGGIDCFLAAKQVGEAGKVIGVDMTPEMIDRARRNAKKAGTRNVEFRIGEIEHLPVADETVDVILSNCVINLSPDKPAVFREAFRVLKRGGRLAISDIVATAPMPEEVRDNVELYLGCVAGAASIDDLKSMLADAGFVDIIVNPNERSREIIREYVPGSGIEDYVVSATIEAVRP
ncbi:MAG: arsenite methyltransferase [Planctomycetota bacterium]|jgi:SAM-dependent methyltransferase